MNEGRAGPALSRKGRVVTPHTAARHHRKIYAKHDRVPPQTA
jgi:hypothetical protein